MGLLETIRAAVAGPGEISVAVEPADANANLNQPSGANKEAVMADKDAAPGAVNTGMSENDHKAAVTKAEAEGRAAGRKEANERMAAILGADGIKGDGGRMAAALDLGSQSPDMASDAVIKFVIANVPAAQSNGASAYEQQRMLAGGLTATGGGEQPKNDNQMALGASLSRANKRR